MADNLDQQAQSGIDYHDGYYVGGDPPPKIGVCTDVVIRSYRAAGVDLKRLVDRDIRRRSLAYRISKPDPNIDCRRTRNLAVFLKRYAKSLPTSGSNADWRPGDIVVFSTRNNGYADHIAVVSYGNYAGYPAMVQAWPGHTVARSPFVGIVPVLYHFRWTSGG